MSNQLYSGIEYYLEVTHKPTPEGAEAGPQIASNALVAQCSPTPSNGAYWRESSNMLTMSEAVAQKELREKNNPHCQYRIVEEYRALRVVE